MPLVENIVKIIGWQPHITQSPWDVTVAIITLERYQANATIHVKLQHVAAIVKSLVTGSPSDLASLVKQIAEFGERNTKIVIRLIISVDGIPKGIGNCPSIGLSNKWRNMPTRQPLRA